MTVVHLEFQDGWTGDPLAVVVNGEVRHTTAPVTRTQIGFAESVELDIGEAEADLELALELADGTRLPVPHAQLDGERWLGISRDSAGALRVREQPTPFGYV